MIPLFIRIFCMSEKFDVNVDSSLEAGDARKEDTTFPSKGVTSSESNMSCIDVQNQKFPFCIVWTPIPLLT